MDGYGSVVASQLNDGRTERGERRHPAEQRPTHEDVRSRSVALVSIWISFISLSAPREEEVYRHLVNYAHVP